MKQIRLKDGILIVKSCSDCPINDNDYAVANYEDDRLDEKGYCEILEKPTFRSTWKIQVRDDCPLEDVVD